MASALDLAEPTSTAAGLASGPGTPVTEDSSKVSFLLNGEPVEVLNPDPSDTLLSYLRRTARLKGTKGLCYQGGCGACTVLLSSPAAVSVGVSGSPPPGTSVSHRAVNSCLRPLCSLDGLSVTTVEGVGSVGKGLHPVQASLKEHNASQCGFCTPGFVMSMYSQLRHKGELSAEEAESVADGNICRCTGYRPILDAFQSLSCGGCPKAEGTPVVLPCPEGVPMEGSAPCTPEIEDLCVSSGRCVKASVVKAKGQQLSGGAPVPRGPRVTDAKTGATWVTVHSLEELFAAVQEGGSAARLVCGNTGSGVYPPPEASLVVDVSRVPELRTIKATAQGITIGAAVTISELMETLQQQQQQQQLIKGLSGSYSQLLTHLKRVANHQVRNMGSVVGNLMLTRQHPEFVSDVATLLCACGASLAVAACGPSADSPVVRMDVLSFLHRKGVAEDANVVVLSLHIPALKKPSQKFLSYKVAQRAVNSHAVANAAFVLSADASGVFLEPPVLVFGGLQPLPARASETEAFLTGKSLDGAVIQKALDVLSSELAPEPSSKKAGYRAMLARSFLYKGLLSSIPEENLPADLRTTTTPFIRPLSTGQTSFDQGDPSEYPVSQPLPKLSEAIQATGEAQYLDDLDHVGELHACYVPASVANAAIAAIDASKALALDGVEQFLSAASLAEAGLCNQVTEDEELLASKRVVYHGQPVGLILASTPEAAAKAAKLVEVQYADVQNPILTLDDAVAKGSFFPDRFRQMKAGDMEAAMAAADAVVEGETAAGHQYHFTTETQRAVCLPGEDGQLVVHSSTQNPSLIQSMVSKGTGVPLHKVKVVVRRVGGAYGSKLNRCAPVAMAAAVAAKAVGRPVRLVLGLNTNMQMVGGRSPYRYKYSVAVSKDGRIAGVRLRVLNNHGAHSDFEYPEMGAFLAFIDNVYNIKAWDVEVSVARTNLPACTWIRAPGNVESLFVTETILDHVASALGLAPEAVRERNLYQAGDVTVWGDKLTYCNASLVLDTIKTSSEYNARLVAVQSFNQGSRWVKRGLSLVPVKYILPWAGNAFTALVNVYPDGTVSIAHGGCEVGQGLNVKVAQTASFALGPLTSDGCPLSGIAVKETTTDVGNSNTGTGGSIGSELTCMATKGACDLLVERLRPVAKALRTRSGRGLSAEPTWQELIAEAAGEAVDLQARFRVCPGDSGHGPSQYCSFGAGVSEVEVDLLTGESRILRTDLLLDCGKSLNPAIDIGQMQGAFVMGLGYFLTEEFEYDRESGKLLTDDTWEYKPPSYADIPMDFRAALLQNSGNPYGFLRSKASGEPPLAMSISALLAVRHALVAGRKEMARRMEARGLGPSVSPPESGNEWLSLPAPATVERVCLKADVPTQLLTL